MTDDEPTLALHIGSYGGPAMR